MWARSTTGSLARAIAARADEGRPVRVGVVGSGEMDTDIVTPTRLMCSIEVVGWPDRSIATNFAKVCRKCGEMQEISGCSGIRRAE